MPPSEARRSSSNTSSGSVSNVAGAVEAARELGEDPEFVAHARRGSDGAAAADDAALEVGHRALLLGPLGDGQHDVGERRRLGEEEVADDEQVERGEPCAHRRDVRRRDDDVRPVHQQRAHAAGLAERLQQLHGGDAGTGDDVGVDAPDARRRAREPRGRRSCGSPGAGRTSGRARGRPGRCPAR